MPFKTLKNDDEFDKKLLTLFDSTKPKKEQEEVEIVEPQKPVKKPKKKTKPK